MKKFSLKFKHISIAMLLVLGSFESMAGIDNQYITESWLVDRSNSIADILGPEFIVISVDGGEYVSKVLNNAKLYYQTPKLIVFANTSKVAMSANEQGKIEIKVNDLIVKAKSAGFRANNNSKIEMYLDKARISAINSALIANQGTIIINANVECEEGISIFSEKNSAIVATQKGEINLEAKRIDISSQENSAILATQEGKINLEAKRIDISSQEKTVIELNNKSEVTIGNQDVMDSIVTINGDILFKSSKIEEKYNYVDATANIVLNGSESFWKGNACIAYPEFFDDIPYVDPAYKTVTGLNISLLNGAQWTPKLIKDEIINIEGEPFVWKSQAINVLTLSDGVINLTEGTEQVVVIEKLKGTGGIFNIKAEVMKDDFNITSGKLRVKEIETSVNTRIPHFDVHYFGITSDDLTDVSNQMKMLVENSIDVSEGSSTQTHIIEEGRLRGRVILYLNSDGTMSPIQIEQNTNIADYRNINALGLVQWRSENNHITKRFGDIRSSVDRPGVWTRLYGGKSHWGNGNGVDMKYTSIHIGSDVRVDGNWLIGGGLGYTDSDVDLLKGDARGEVFSLSTYATYLSDSGAYLDLIGSYGYLKNDASMGNMKIDIGSNALSFSVEGGYQYYFLNNKAYIEPQIGVTYGVVFGDVVTASNGVRIDQKDFQSFITRVGVRTGFEFPEKAGTLYALLSYSYDHIGRAEAMATYKNLKEDLRDELGNGWLSYGLGAQFKLGNNIFARGELERTTGGEIGNPYLFNVGIHWNF